MRPPETMGVRPPESIAPAAGGPGGGGSESTFKRTRAGAIPFGRRLFPTDSITLLCLGALLRPEGRERFRHLGIPPGAFEEDDERAVAAMLLEEREPTAHDLCILGRDDGERMTWMDALEWRWPTDPGWAVYIVNLFADAYARRWLPAFLRWAADQVEAGAWTPAHAADEVGPLFRLASPTEGRAA
jgi:hypothetical protein